MPIEARSLLDLPETELVQRLVAEPHWGDPAMHFFDLPTDGIRLLEVDLAGLGKRGDIDLLAARRDRPDQAIAIQFKRIKVGSVQFAEEGMPIEKRRRPNKLSEISKLHAQSSLLVSLGFWRVYSCALVVVDSRLINPLNDTLNGLTPDLQCMLNRALDVTGLHESAGFVVVDLGQPQNRDPLTTGTIGSQLRRLPKSQVQCLTTTAWVAQLIADKSSSR